jgi:hypothetical protein
MNNLIFYVQNTDFVNFDIIIQRWFGFIQVML